MKFESYNFPVEIKRSISELGFRKPTDIQYKSIPPIIEGEDVLAIAQTGTGKTAAFAIPILNNLMVRNNRGSNEGVRCLVMAPTHELAMQITEVFEKLAKYSRLKIACVFGGVDQEPQINKLTSGVDILIATPGRMFDLVSQGFINLGFLEILVLDEADHMLDLGFIRDIRDLIKFLPKKRQTLFFSATIDTDIKTLAYSLVNKPVRIQISPKDPVSKNITHSVAFIEPDDKRYFLERVIKENPDVKILVFVRTKVRAERVLKAMERVDIKCETIHGDKTQPERFDVMKQFKTGDLKILVATDVSARGIDIPNVEFVINYDLPDVAENYVHRVGRTGRGTKQGKAVSFCSKEELPILNIIEEYLTKKINVLEIDKKEYQETLIFTDEVKTDWKSLIKEDEEFEKELKKHKKKKPEKKKPGKKKK